MNGTVSFFSCAFLFLINSLYSIDPLTKKTDDDQSRFIKINRDSIKKERIISNNPTSPRDMLLYQAKINSIEKTEKKKRIKILKQDKYDLECIMTHGQRWLKFMDARSAYLKNHINHIATTMALDRKNSSEEVQKIKVLEKRLSIVLSGMNDLRQSINNVKAMLNETIWRLSYHENGIHLIPLGKDEDCEEED